MEQFGLLLHGNVRQLEIFPLFAICFYEHITKSVIESFYVVDNTLGYGFMQILALR